MPQRIEAMAAKNVTATATRERIGVLAERDFRYIFVGQALSTLGDAAATITVAFAVLAIGGSASALGAVLAARCVPLAACLLIGGVVADRVPRHRLMLVSDVLRALVQGILAALLLSGDTRLWLIILLQVVYGTAEAFFTPALTGLVPQLVTDGRLQQANALLRMTFALSVIVGPGLGGLLVAGTGAGVLWPPTQPPSRSAHSSWPDSGRTTTPSGGHTPFASSRT